MEVDLTPDQTAFVRQAIESGRLNRPEDAVNSAQASLAAGKGRIITEDSMRQLADEVKRRGRARFAAEQQTPC
jgi:hypothetical protein